MENAGAILPALAEFNANLQAMQETLITGNGEKFAALFRHGRNLRDSWLCYKKSHNLPENIVLCGIKHCGKTTVGREIAAILDLPLVDTDNEIEKLDGKNRSCREIFSQEGEEYFRKLEADVLEKLAASTTRQIIALGGGALDNQFLQEKTKTQLGFTVCIDTDDKTAFERITRNGLPPFLQKESDPFAAFSAMNSIRRKTFARYANISMKPEPSPRLTALQILSFFAGHCG